MITKGLVVKGLVGASAVAAIGVGIGQRKQIREMVQEYFFWGEAELLRELGLSCTVAECTLNANKSLEIRRGEEKIEVTSAWEKGGNKGKLSKFGGEGGYRFRLKFRVDGGDINLGNSKKLEEFETYEIGEEGGKWYLERKNGAEVEIKRELGLPGSCSLPTNSQEITCPLDKSTLGSLNFPWRKSNGGDPKIEGEGGTISLKIKKIEGEEKKDEFSEGYRFTLQSDRKITFAKGNGEEEIIEANTGTVFRIFKLGNKLEIKRAWSLEPLAKKVGFKSCGSNNDECGFTGGTEGTISFNLFNSSTDYTVGAGVVNGDKDKKMKVERAAGYFQGFKFISPQDIALENGNPSATNKKIEGTTSNPNASYEIREETAGGVKK